ncbi:MAG: dTDP-4-dehydrorhamnose reductase [Candidatus Marinimicrobia bacterium CG08_land_8_20_14_0_20_45_22]|nr:MAG: dTDP-4-dehydrorhamnose reductase [Candidatus Marinimicrobia bacterium CG08_land_8_20_14_0_20_45_22]
MRILITGANGMLGEKCTDILAEKHKLLATDLADKLTYSNTIPYMPLDITNGEDVKRVISEFQPELILNCAAYTNVDGAEKNRELAHRVNVDGVKNILIALTGTDAKIIHISTDYVFDGTRGPYHESDTPKPINYYGMTKLLSEEAIRHSSIPWTIIRTNVLFGDSNFQEASFVSWVLNKITNRETIRVVNDQFGNPTWADGLAMAIDKVIDKQILGLYHYAGSDYINRFEFALEIASIYSLDPTFIRPITTRTLGQLAPRPFKAGLITDLIRKEIDVKIFSIKEALTIMKGTE